MIYVLADSLAAWHSYRIRIGQYLDSQDIKYQLSDNIDILNHLQSQDILIIYRYNEAWGDVRTILSKARSIGVFIITDIDDYLWEAKSWSKYRKIGLTHVLKSSHLITTSTNELAGQISVMFGGKVKVMNNTGGDNTPDKREFQFDKIQVGWTGAPWTREQDILLIKDVFIWLFNRRNKFDIVHIGNSDNHRSLAEILQIPVEAVKTINLLGYEEYKNSIQFDIGLAPLSKSNFNIFKSEIKILEYSSRSIPWIASKETPYLRLCNEWNIEGRLCKTTDEWINHLRELTDKDLRRKEGEDLKKLCNKTRSFQHAIDEWKQILKLR